MGNPSPRVFNQVEEVADGRLQPIQGLGLTPQALFVSTNLSSHQPT
jgi:hypothetical protein